MWERLINCGHYPELFIPGATKVPEVRQDEDENAQQYAESQQQRALERAFRQARLDLDVARAQGADDDEIRHLRGKLQDADADLDRFTRATGRKRRREREYAPINATWPKPTTDSQTAVLDAMREYFESGGIQNGL